MGLWDAFDDDVRTSRSRRDDQTGTFWLLFDAIKEEEADSGVRYLKAYRTTVKVVDPGDGEQDVGDETTHAFFPSKKYKFFERDTKLLVKAAMGLSTEQADRLTRGDVEAALVSDGDGSAPVIGAVVETRCRRVPPVLDEEGEEVKKAYTRVEYVRRVPAAELEAALPETDVQRFFPTGLPQDPPAMRPKKAKAGK